MLKLNREKTYLLAVASQWLSQLSRLAILFAGISLPAYAQPIAPREDGTHTEVTRDRNRYDITGGQTSRDGANLFHSFEQFNLNSGEIANFHATPAIANILSRIVGGDPSLINGLIQITGGNPNLFLINPAGILFGPDARLNVPGSFTATTATGIGFDRRWLSAIGDSDYSHLIGTPNRFEFPAQPSPIVNLGNLTLTPGHDLALLGGTILNTGTLAAPDGNLIVAAIPGQHRVRISQPHHLLSLDIAPSPDPARVSAPLTSVSLPQLLTGGEVTHARDIQVYPDGRVELTGAGLSVDAGDVATNSHRAHSATLSAQGNLTLFSSPGGGGSMQTTGNLTGVAQETVQIRDSATDPLQIRVGGQLTLSGNEIDIFALNHPASGLVAGGDMRLRSPNSAIGDARFSTGGNFRIETCATPTCTHSTPGDLVSPQDPAIFARGDVSLGSYEGGSLGILAGGSVTLGDVTITGRDPNATGFPQFTIPLPDGSQIAVDLASQPQLVVLSGVDLSDPQLNLPRLDAVQPAGSLSPTVSARATGADIQTGNIRIASGDGAVILSNTVFPNLALPGGAIATGAIDTSSVTGNAGDAIILSRSEINTSGGLLNATARNGNGGNAILSAEGNIVTSAIQTLGDLNGGAIRITSNTGTVNTGGERLVSGGEIANANTGEVLAVTDNSGEVAIAAQGNISTGNIFSFSEFNSGDIRIESRNGTIDTGAGNLIATSRGEGGNISVRSQGNIVANDIQSASLDGSGTGGDITLESGQGSVRTGDLLSSGELEGGAIAISAPNSLQLGGIDTSAEPGNGGSVTLTSGGRIQLSFITARGGDRGTGGTVNISSAGVFQATATLTEPEVFGASIFTAGGTGSGAISLRHGGGTTNPPTPFAIGDATFNGTAGVVTTGETTLTPLQVYPSSFEDNNVRFLTETPPAASPAPTPEPTPDPEPTPEPEPTPDPEPMVDYENRPPLNERAIAPDTQLVAQPLDTEPLEVEIEQLEASFTEQFDRYLGFPTSPTISSVRDIRNLAAKVEQQTGQKPAFIYLSFVPPGLQFNPGNSPLPQDTDQLEIIALTSRGKPLRRRVAGATRARAMSAVRAFRAELTKPSRRQSETYLSWAQQFYQWIVTPIEADLQARNIDRLVFIMDTGLRSLPIAALHDGKQFAIERYSMGIMPSLSLADTSYTDIRNARVLAMGASTFSTLSPLPAVPVELKTIVGDLWPGEYFLNEGFTMSNLLSQREQVPFGIVHLATHGVFRPGDPSNSYIQLWEERLRLNEIRELGWNDPPVQLLVLSACSTAVGDAQAELGFAGLAINAGAQTAVASLWSVSDEGTLALMSKFYEQLRQTPIVAEALRQAQLALLRGEVRIENGRVQGTGKSGSIVLPTPLDLQEGRDFSHPYYWSGFTTIGSPW